MEFGGLTTALITPFKEGKLDEKGFRENLWFQIEAGVDALLVLGSTGEGNSLTEAEQQQVTDIAVSEAKGNIPLWVSCGGVSTDQTIEKARVAEERGADALLVIAPYYCRPMQEGLLRHFEAVAHATPLPIILYNHPKRAGVTIEQETLKRLSGIENIIGIKDASGSIGYGAAVMDSVPDLLFLVGDDLMALPFLSIGAGGLVSVLSNLMPGSMKELVETRDLSLYRTLYPFMALSQVETNPIPIKAMMELEGLPAGKCRLPLTPLSEKNQKRLSEMRALHG
ncbi:MAG: 4-hydroxy-tetrahydrodipicolinate synthase [Chlamydiia bacterium]|nr:4-hydroxy-tetrahydrodipicolinate synthase [Chlamydiia bacterium]